jgi:hypothetical protein
MYKLLRMAVLALPLGGGVALAQSAASDTNPPMGTQRTTDTRTTMQKRAGELDDNTSAVPGDATKPRGVPETAPMSDRAGLPESAGQAKPPAEQKSAAPAEQKSAAPAEQKSAAPAEQKGAAPAEQKSAPSPSPSDKQPSSGDVQRDQNPSDK